MMAHGRSVNATLAAARRRRREGHEPIPGMVGIDAPTAIEDEDDGDGKMPPAVVGRRSGRRVDGLSFGLGD